MAAIDCDRFRLRRFVGRLAAEGEALRIEEPIEFADLARDIESRPQASWFLSVGPDKLEMVAAVSASRRRLAMAFESDERHVTETIAKRLATPQPVVEVASAEAPVHAVGIKGDDVDLSRLPFYLQHELDGGTYISSALDFTIDPETGKRNVGCRRLMLHSRNTCTTNLTETSDLRGIYRAAVAREERLPVSFVIGVQPTDFMAGVLKAPGDEFAVLAALRGSPAPYVKCVTNDILVPADAEMVLEGYLGAEGYVDLDGPYGEFWATYGLMHDDPIFHVTAITMRADVLYQTVVHGGHRSADMETNHATALACELVATRTLCAAGIEPVAVYSPPGATLFQSIRVALRRADHERAKDAIQCLIKIPGFKHVVVADDDVDIFDDQEIHWAISNRFRADRDLVIAAGPGFYEDPLAEADRTTAKMGMDATSPGGWPSNITQRRTNPPQIVSNGTAALRDVLARGPKYFIDLMRETGSRDGRELAIALGELSAKGELKRLPDGEYALKSSD
jgi:2,5-furandicarboxylate decarboxylase 1